MPENLEKVSFCGYICIAGLPNAGKSTFLNACLGQKIAGVSRKPQTTRHKIIGILTRENSQYLFIDTPGIHQKKNSPLNHRMLHQAWQGVSNSDLVLYFVDLKLGFQDFDQINLIEIASKTQAPILVVATKRDAVAKDDIRIKRMAIKNALQAIITEHPELSTRLTPKPFVFSSKIAEDVAELLQKLATHLPAGPFLYPEEDLTNMSENFVIEELIREKTFRNLGEELPYHIYVSCLRKEEVDSKIEIQATINVNRDSQKGMVVGAGGQKIKQIREQSQRSLSQFFGQKVKLSLDVRENKGWIQKDLTLDHLFFENT